MCTFSYLTDVFKCAKVDINWWMTDNRMFPQKNKVTQNTVLSTVVLAHDNDSHKAFFERSQLVLKFTWQCTFHIVSYLSVTVSESKFVCQICGITIIEATWYLYGGRQSKPLNGSIFYEPLRHSIRMHLTRLTDILMFDTQA